MLWKLSILFLFVFAGVQCKAQSDSIAPFPKSDYQIYLKQPAKEIKQLLYEKDCTPIDGSLSGNKKSIIMKDYEQGSKVHVIVIYEDGTEDEFVRSPCFIDPVLL
jgi:hypothetical protein